MGLNNRQGGRGHPYLHAPVRPSVRPTTSALSFIPALSTLRLFRAPYVMNGKETLREKHHGVLECVLDQFLLTQPLKSV